MGTSILEAFVVTFALQSDGFKKGAKEVEQASNRARDTAKKTFGEIEDHGKAMGQAFRSMRNEVAGLFLVLSGAGSLTGFLTQMATGAAGAERLGQTLGMATGKIYAWREAMKKVGGQPASADAALSSIEGAVQSYKLTGSTGIDADLLGFGIGRSDLNKGDPGEILKKIADARGNMDGPQFAARLQRIGMPSDMINLLMKGGGDVRATIEKYERNSKALADVAKETETLQASLADLDNSITKTLVPVLNKLLPPLTTIANLLSDLIQTRDPMDAATGGKNAWDYIGQWVTDQGFPDRGKWIQDHMGANGFSGNAEGSSLTFGAQLGRSNVRSGSSSGDPIISFLMSKGLTANQAIGIRAGIWAEGGTASSRNPSSGAYGIGQWLSKDRIANFRKRTGRDIHGSSLQQQLEFLWWELNGGDAGGKHVLAAGGAGATAMAYITRFMRPHQGAETLGDLRRANQYLRGHTPNSVTHIASMPVTVHTQAKDAPGIAKSIGHAIRQNVQRADGGVAH